MPLGDRINPAAREPAAGQRFLAGVGETDFRVAAQAHLARPALPKEAQNPFLRPARRDGQLQAAAVAVFARLRCLDLARCQLAHAVGPQVSPQIWMRL
jgi:hypothetical protein